MEQLLNKDSIIEHVGSENSIHLKNLEIFDSLPSTNTYLAENKINSPDLFHICLAENQTAGKGRLGKKWISPSGYNVYLSIRQKLPKESINALSGLAIAIGVAIVETLKKCGINHDIKLKWPNDVLWQNRKLAGTLIELCDSEKFCNLIVGVGLNVNMTQQFAKQINQPFCSMAEIMNNPIDRNQAAGFLIDDILSTLSIFQTSGLKPFIKTWQKLDATLGKQITLITPSRTITGIGRGINFRGNLSLEDKKNNIYTFSSAEVSLALCEKKANQQQNLK
jgi:BirA family transcriptional regulator, biotin operon repressor / biotin---[acetyl-CoA-carboxylase] ligase